MERGTRNDLMWKAKLEQLLNDMARQGFVESTKYSQHIGAVARGYMLSCEPPRWNTEEYNAYVNLRYHAENPGALFANDRATRRGVQMALEAVCASLEGNA